MTEDEFRALLAIEGKELGSMGRASDGVYFVVVSKIDSLNFQDWAYGKTQDEAIQKLIAQHYADN